MSANIYIPPASLAAYQKYQEHRGKLAKTVRPAMSTRYFPPRFLALCQNTGIVNICGNLAVNICGNLAGTTGPPMSAIICFPLTFLTARQNTSIRNICGKLGGTARPAVSANIHFPPHVPGRVSRHKYQEHLWESPGTCSTGNVGKH